ncbi:MAG: ParA family protein [Jatrophihabitantaceae bacterium]
MHASVMACEYACMHKPRTTVVYSEAGGATKTTTAVSLSVAMAEAGRRVILIDLDPRGATTKWLGVEPTGPGLHVGAILADPDPVGWVADLAVPSPWKRAGDLRVVPSHRQVSNREKSSEDHAELRLLQALQGVDVDEVIIDSPNRQGGPLIQNALNAADRVIYAGKLDEDGLDGVEGARTSVMRFKESRRMLGASDSLVEAGIVVGMVRDTILTRDSRRVRDIFGAEYGELLLLPMIPERVVVREARAAGDFYGWYPAGERVYRAYQEIAEKVMAR